MTTTTTDWSAALILLPLLLLPVTVGLIAYGWRGRRVGDHPVCRRCGFDLFGKPAGSAVCAECGADLGRPRAVRVGHRRRRRGPLWAGGVLLLLVGAWAGVAGYAAARDIDPDPYKPVWWLRREMGSADRATRDAALAEVKRRIDAGALSDEQITSVTTRVLDLQADRSVAWIPAWGDLVESARRAGKLSDADWARYARQAPVISIEVRPHVRRGDLLPYWVADSAARLGSDPRLRLRYDSRKQTVFVGGIEVPKHGGYSTGSGSLSTSGTGRRGTNIDLKPLLDRLADGPQTLRLKATFEVDDEPAPGSGGLNDDDNNPALASLDVDLTAHWTLHPADRPTVKLIRDPAHRGAVEAALEVETVRVDKWDPKYEHLNLTVNAKGVPVGVGYQVVLRGGGGREWNAGRFACPAGTNAHSYGLGERVKGFPVDLDTVDVVFKPSVEAAANTTNTFEIWDGEVVLKGVKVERPKPNE